jgi:hypothetical protein
LENPCDNTEDIGERESAGGQRQEDSVSEDDRFSCLKPHFSTISFLRKSQKSTPFHPIATAA